MALKVWLPLDGDLRNLGCSNIGISSIEATPTYVNGKIGQCYQRANSSTQSTNGIKLDTNFLDIFETQASIAVWIKPLGTHTHYNGTILSSGDWNKKRWSFGVSQDNSQVDVLCGGHNNYLTCAVPANEWTHLVSTFDNGVCKVYKNGEYVGEKTGQSAFDSDATWTGVGRESYASGYFGFNGLINDLRIYDHVLSATEAHELAQGLVLHYKLDNGNMGLPNLISKSTYSAAPWATAITGTATVDGKLAYLLHNRTLYSNTSSGSTTLFPNITFEENTQYTVSIDWRDDYRTDGKNSNLRIYFKYTDDTTTRIQSPSRDKSIWTHTSMTSTAGKTVSMVTASYGNGGILYIANLKLEKNSFETPWSLPTDEINTVFDSSGYNHNGAINGNITVEPISPRYSIHTNFTDSACAIGIGNLSTLLPEGIFTFNIWFKKVTGEWSSKTWETILGGPSGFELEGKLSSTQNAYIHPYSWGGGSTSTPNNYSIAYTLDEWHMLTMVRTSSNTLFYLDGEYKVTGSKGSLPSGDYFIGSWQTAAKQNYRGHLSDARIYCTALLDNDIKMLYNTGMKIDNLNALHTFEVNESGSRELMQGINITTPYSNHTISCFSNYNNGELYFNTNNSSAGSNYIPISPSGKTYYYDFEISVNTGNQFYIGIERYDADKTSRENNACLYPVAIKPTSDLSHKRYYGTINLSTDGVNPCAFIALRVLNGWSGTTSGVTGIATIHRLSLREVTTIQKPNLLKTGVFQIDELNEQQRASFYSNGIVETSELIEI